LGGKLIISASNFTNNKAEYEGGGLYTSHVSAQIQESLFKSNSVADDIPMVVQPISIWVL